jgi:membrane associated rhomboid family serine protease
MILIPLGHEHEAVRRRPLVTFGVMAACLVAFLAVWLGGGGADERAEQRVGEAVEYFLEHPYLELDPKLSRLLFGGQGDETVEELLSIYRQQYPAPDDAGVVAEQQARLDELTAAALGVVDGHPLRRWGLVPAQPDLLSLLSHMFMHAGWMHLLGNLLILYLAGPFIEDVWGRGLYFGFYVLAGIAAAVAHMASTPESMVPMIGASGAIAGVMGAFLVRYGSSRIEFFYMIGLFARGTFWAPAWLMLPLWFGEQLFMGLMVSGLGIEGGVAYWAHAGGFLFGVAFAFALRSARVEERYIAPRIEAKVSPTVVRTHPLLERALRLKEGGEPRAAWMMLSRVLADEPHNLDACLSIWDIATSEGWVEQGAPALQQVIREELRTGDHEMAIRHWLELLQHCPQARVEPGLLARIALALAANRQLDEAGQAMRAALDQGAAGVTTSQLLKLGGFAKTLDQGLARRAAELALERPDLHPSEREEALALAQAAQAVQPVG